MNSGPAEREHDLLVAAARAVLAALRDPIEQRTLSRAALGALRMLEGAIDDEPPRRARR